MNDAMLASYQLTEPSRACAVCGVVFFRAPGWKAKSGWGHRKYCGEKCRYRANNKPRPRRGGSVYRYNRKCKKCGIDGVHVGYYHEECHPSYMRPQCIKCRKSMMLSGSYRIGRYYKCHYCQVSCKAFVYVEELTCQFCNGKFVPRYNGNSARKGYCSKKCRQKSKYIKRREQEICYGKARWKKIAEDPDLSIKYKIHHRAYMRKYIKSPQWKANNQKRLDRDTGLELLCGMLQLGVL